MDETGIIADCKKGSSKAQKLLFENYSKGMLLLCRRYVKDNQDAEEILLTGFFKFFSTIERFEYTGGNSIGGWLKRIMVNECFMFLRKNKNIIFVEDEFAENVTLDAGIFEKMNANAILQLINTLPDGYRIVFNLYVVEGYNHKEIAEMLQISEGGSKSQLSRARSFLQKLIEKEQIVL
jgi:RNA polymerase sigma factor (sigma-70 family)